MNNRSFALCVLWTSVVLGTAGIAVVVWEDPGIRAPVPKLADENPGIEGTRRQIAAESKAGVREATVYAAPIPAAPRSSGPSAEPLDTATPTAPEGYSFTSAPTELTVVARQPASERSAGAESTLDEPDQLAWLFADPNATGDMPLPAIARQARRMQRDWAFGWLRLADGASVQEVRSAAAPFGVDILAASGRLLRAKLPADEASLAAAAALPGVSGLGVMPPERKTHEAFRAEVHAAPLGQQPVLITLMAHDQNGRWRHALEALGVEVGRFDADLRAYAANVDAAALDAALQADFVLAIEPMGMVQAAHDTAVPAMGADAVRFHADSPGLFTGIGGGSVPIGVMDTGLNTNHMDIASHRRSICGANFVWRDHRTEDADLWVDEDGHGTHVTGTIAGNGFLEPKYAGMAPAVAHIRFAKVLDRGGSGPSDGIYRGMDFLSRASVCGAQAVAAKPLVVNMSLAATNRRWLGRSSSERKLDAVVWAHRQLYVVAQSNFDIGGFSNFGAAKSSLSVGAIRDDGELATFSSWGPTFDGRLAPQVVATGVDVYSARGGGRRGGYQPFSGTSMASPATAGVAALLMDAVADYREQPALARARLMASAIKPDAWLETGDAFAATNSVGPGVIQAQYGLGKASARTSVLQREEADGWENGAATSTLMHGDTGYHDIEVPEGASRLDLVLAWDEPPADTIGSTVLNDLDLWLHRDANCEDAECGDYASVSRRDNVEWVIVKNPTPGTYRASVVARRVYSAPPRAGLAWTVVRGPSTPTLRLTVDEIRSIGEREYRVVLSLSVDGYVAAGVQVGVIGCRAAAGKECDGNVNVRDIRPVTGEDGTMYSPPYANRVLVGEVSVGERQQVAFDVKQYENRSSPPEYDSTRLYFTASAWNATSAVASAALPGTDGEQPPAEAAPPENDDFSDATVLNGASGTIEADLLAATVEPGEPPRLRGGGGGERPAASVWFRWTAPARGSTRFGVKALTSVDIFRGQHIAALTPLAFGSWGLSFFAEEGETYRIRVSRSSNYYGDPAQLMLSWSQGPRPANDDFVDAVELAGAEGEVAGDNRGATLEPGELLGDLAATVWYRWTAPEDGAWRFRADHWQSVVLVFTGNSLTTLRLVSGNPGSDATIPVEAGAEYRIAVAAESAFSSGRTFDLEWEKYERETDADDFANAIELEGASGSESVTVGDSVEPDEPVQTGVRTRWWRWVASASGRFTWRLADTTDTEIKIAVFAPTGGSDQAEDSEDSAETSLAMLQLVATTGPRVTATELSFDAVDGQRYWISLGFHTGDDAAFAYGADATLEWGEAPANDSLAQAIALAGSSGSTTVSNDFATLAPEEPSGVLGHSSVWWSFTPSDAGWYHFWMEDADAATLAVYRVRGAGFDGLERVARSHGDWQAPHEEDSVSVLFDAIAEQRYLIRVGQRGDGTDAEWTLNWDQADAPTWLRYAGRLRPASLGLTPDSAPTSAALAFEDGGDVLYLGTTEGIHVLSRDAGSGALEQVRIVDTEEAQALLWDRTRSKLYALVGCDWRRFAPSEDSRLTLVDEGALQIDGDIVPSCDVQAAFLDPTQAFLYHGHPDGIDVYAIGETGLTTVQSVAIEGFQHAVSGRAGTRIYATDGDSLQVLTRDASDESTGSLTAAGDVELATRAVAIATSADDAYLAALAEDGTTDAYELTTDPTVPQHLNTLNAVGSPTWRDAHGECGFVVARNGSPAIDAFCRNSAFSAAIRVVDESASLGATDYVANWQADRFNNYIPEFKSQALAASPDGRHAYVYSEGDILIFERIGKRPPTASTEPDIALGR